MSKGDLEYLVLYMILIVGSCLFFGILYVVTYFLLLICEVIPNTVYRIWKEIKHERDTRRKDS